MQYEALHKGGQEESSSAIRERVCRAREIQHMRYRGTKILTNAMLQTRELEMFCALGAAEEKLMRQAFSRLGLTARTYHKILKVARTIADLDGEAHILERHLKEAVGYRSLDKKYWGR